MYTFLKIIKTKKCRQKDFIKKMVIFIVDLLFESKSFNIQASNV